MLQSVWSSVGVGVGGLGSEVSGFEGAGGGSARTAQGGPAGPDTAACGESRCRVPPGRWVVVAPLWPEAPTAAAAAPRDPAEANAVGPGRFPARFPSRLGRARGSGAWSRTGRPAGVVSRFPTLRVTWSGGGVEMPVSRDLGGGRSPPRFCKEGGLRPGCPWSGGRVVVPSWVPGSLAGFGKGRTRSELGFLKAFSVGEQNVGAMRTLKQEDLWLFSKLTAVKR